MRIDTAELRAAFGHDGDGNRAAHRRRSTRSRASRSTSASPQQLGSVLFEDLNLPAPVKYGKGKTISTAADVLEDLAAEHEIVRKVLEYRQLTKLKGTYVDALPALIDPRTRPPAHQLQPDRRGHRAAFVLQSEPAEYSHPHGAGPRDPRGVHAARRLEADGGRLFADRTAAAGAYVGRSACWWTRSATAKTSTRAPPRK